MAALGTLEKSRGRFVGRAGLLDCVPRALGPALLAFDFGGGFPFVGGVLARLDDVAITL